MGRDNDQQPVQATENGGVWGAATEVPGSPGGSGSFSAVSCTAATSCTAVGSDGSGEPIYEVDSTGVWGAPDRSDGGLGWLWIIRLASAAPRATDCTAVGVDGRRRTRSTPLRAVEPGARSPRSRAAHATTGSFASVSCVSVGSCTAVGGDSDGHPIYAAETGGVWGTPVEVPGGPGSFTGVSCTGSGNCTAVGSKSSLPVYGHGDRWGLGQPHHRQSVRCPAQEVAASFSAVSCVAVGTCTAVGGDSNGQPIYATETGGVWGTATELPAGASGSFTGVSCIDPTDCSAIGNSDGGALYATETAGAWSTPATIVSDSGTIVVTGLSCTVAGNCTAVGYDSRGRRTRTRRVPHPDGWRMERANDALSARQPWFWPLYGVSCTDANDCTAVGRANAPDSGSGIGAPVYATEGSGTWGTPTALSGTPDGTGDLTERQLRRRRRTALPSASTATSEPIYTSSSDAAVVPTVTSVAPTVSSIRPERGPEKPTCRKMGRLLRPDPHAYVKTHAGRVYPAFILDA